MERRDFLKTLVALPAVAKALALANEPGAVFPITGDLEKFAVEFPDGCAFAFSGWVTMIDPDTMTVIPQGAVTITDTPSFSSFSMLPVLHVGGQPVAEIKDIGPPSISTLENGLLKRGPVTFTVDFNTEDLDDQEDA